MSASSSQPKDQPTSSHKGADQKQLVVAPGTSVEAANRSVLLCETEVQLEKLALDTQRDQKKESDACANDGEEVKLFFKLAERGGAAKMRAMLKGPNADVLLSAKVNGVTALSVAVQEGNTEVAELLRANGPMDVKSPAVKFDLTPQNRWDSAVCVGGHFTLVEPDRLIVEMMDMRGWGGAIAAERPIPKKDSGIFYYEMNILKLEQNALVGIGLATIRTWNIPDPPLLVFLRLNLKFSVDGTSCRAYFVGAVMVYRMLRQSARVICVKGLQQGKPKCYYEEAMRRLNAVAPVKSAAATRKEVDTRNSLCR